MKPEIDKKMMFRSAQEQALYMLISREEIESMDVEPTLSVLENIVNSGNAEYIWSFKNTVTLVFDGYNADPREIYEIPEVCKFVERLLTAFPYWFFFLSLTDETLIIFMLCAIKGERKGIGRAYIRPDAIKKFLYEGFEGTNKLFAKHKYSDDELILLTKGVIQVFENAMEGE